MKLISLKNRIGADNRRHLSANGFSLLPLALRPRLFLLMIGIGALAILNGAYCNGNKVSALYSATITTSGSKSIDVSFNDDGTAISADAISVSTNCRAGYNLSVATSVNDNNLYYDGSASNNEAGTYFTPVDGTNTLDNSNNVNKWGYYYNSSNSTAPTKTSIFSAVPAFNGTPATLVTPTSSETDISDSFNVYYGVAVNSNLKVGTYKMIQDTSNNNNNGSIIYYLTMAESCMPYTVQFNPTSTANNTTLSGTGTMSSQTIPVGEATNLDSNTFTPPSGYKFKEWNTAQDGTGTAYTDAQSVTNLTTPGNTITLYAQWEKIDPCRSNPTWIYCKVKAMSKGKQTNDKNATTGIQAAIVAPTEAVPVSRNSGVYEYDATVFGADSDANNSSGEKDTIYYYRGILDSYGNTGTYGSNGLADAYPNYVILDSDGTVTAEDTTDTCWRIVRTTGSGGVKMIYNGTWTGTTCANAQANAQVGTSAFNGTSSTYQQMVRVGYTYNSTYAINTAQSGTIAQIFGTNSTPSVNDTRSTIKEYIEDTWYASNMTAYTSILEPSAGYCNDRTMNTTSGWTTPLTESSTIAATYGTSSLQAYYFGAYVRNMKTNQPPSLTCGNKYSQIDRSIVDLYRYNGTNNAAGSTTANYLKYPAALLTADELSFAGSGSSAATNGSSYNAKSYLRSGNDFWLLSPSLRGSSGGANGFVLAPNGRLDIYYVDFALGVRPAISLKPGTTAASGTGIATDPWVVTAP